MKTDLRLGEHIVAFGRLSEICVEDYRAVGDPKLVAHHLNDFVNYRIFARRCRQNSATNSPRSRLV